MVAPMQWAGVMPAITTPFTDADEIDHEFLAAHAAWLAENGCSGLVCLGNLGEGPTLRGDERRAVLETAVAAVGGSIPVVAGVPALCTRDAIALCQTAADAGCRGLMLSPPVAHRGPWRETRAHLGAMADATKLPCMLHNHPDASGTDLTPAQIAELAAAHETIGAVKDATGDVRRVTAIRAATDDRLAVLVGLDDMLVEGVAAGAVGWIAGLANALPKEACELFWRVRDGGPTAADSLYRWFLPLLQLDALPDSVQWIKLLQAEVDMGSARVRPPRLALPDEVLESGLESVRAALAAKT